MPGRERTPHLVGRDSQSFTELCRRFRQPLAAFVRRRTHCEDFAVDEVVQITLLKAWRSFDTYRGDSAPLTWLCGICKRTLIDTYRRAAHPAHATLSLDEWNGDEELAVFDASLCAVDQSIAIRDALVMLPPAYKRVLQLKYWKDLSVREVAEALGISVKAAQSKLYRAHVAFRHAWREQSV